MRRVVRWLAAVGLGLELTAGVARAQQEGLVNVDVSHVRVDIAMYLDVNVSQVPVTVQAPIYLAGAEPDRAAQISSQ